mmetsp:Transcript_16372/g.19638  ORF Transcript_16372/g.19638 Transcript_16372/m.19638 type:complete len:819 (-) Transcript_16372:1183-3639(-)|eukprot:CAMPEP_0197848748 /NCGR_PEP_ID=MMETSP1438-20131217/9884_1 /TAXON_ID=1461541 /ORGANISM="Pterosperma sp., Strain CCMP1384" /LENGTH=818 /DNA_ID=CAMNT_0043461143 /DNA_START=293 /DNA_END=2749 /DNA_ORIENTATION=+
MFALSHGWKVVFCLLLLVACAQSAVFKGKLNGPQSWQYLSRFCFLPTDHQTGGAIKGQIEATFRFPQDHKLTLLEYIERSQAGLVKAGSERVTSFDAWKDVYNGRHNCTSRMDKGMAFPLYDPALESACKNIFVIGREGTNNVVNGLWKEYTIPTFGGRRIYAKQNADTWLFIYFMVDAGAWYIAREIGSKLVVAEAVSEAMSPDMIRATWYIADGQGSFEEDPNMQTYCADDYVNAYEEDDSLSADWQDIMVKRPPPPPPGVKPSPPPISTIGGKDRTIYSLSDIDEMGDENRAFFRMISMEQKKNKGYGMVPDADGYITTTRVQTFEDDKARWLFLALSHCDQRCAFEGGSMCQGSLEVEYELILTNGEGWGVKHFSADEHSILETEIFFFAFQFLLILGGFHVRSVLLQQQKYHHTVRLLLASICATLFADFFDIIHYCKFANDGIGIHGLHMFSIWLTGVSDTCLLLLVVLVAKGWSICCRKLSATGRVKISIYTTVYLSVFSGMLLWFEYGMSDAQVVYIYHSVPGYLIVALRCLGTVWMCYATFVTLTKFRMKRRFFKKFLFTFGIWQMSLPLVVAIALAIPTWTRAKVVNTMELVFTYGAQLALLLLYYPGRYNRSFPFHATTSDMLPRNATRVVISKKNNIPGEENNEDPAARTQTFGNTRVVSSGLTGGRLEKAALRSAMELAGRVSSDMVSLTGCLEQMDAADDDEEALEDNSGFNDLRTVGGMGGQQPSMRNMMAQGPASTGMGSQNMGAQSLRNSMSRNGGGFGGEPLGPPTGGGIGSNGGNALAAALGPSHQGGAYGGGAKFGPK